MCITGTLSMGKKDSHNSPFNDVEDVEDVDYEEIDKE